MAYTTINKSSLFQNTKLYTGNGGTNAQTGVGFQPDWIWFKRRDGSDNHIVFDVVRGVTKGIYPDLSNAEDTLANSLSSFNSDGFTLGADTGSGGAINGSGESCVAWNWKAGTAVSGNTGGSGSYKAYSGSVNATAGFSIIKYIGNGSGGHTIPHRLGVAPSNVIIKAVTSNSWICKMQGYNGYLYLNESNAGTSNSNWLPTDANNLTLANNWGAYNTNNVTYVAYCFSEKVGYSKFGKYTGNGNADGPFTYTGFKPAFVMIKRTDAVKNWYINDNKRNGYNPSNPYLSPNLNAAETGGTEINILSNGFKITASGTGHNQSGGSYIYMAFGQSIVGTNNVPATAR